MARITISPTGRVLIIGKPLVLSPPSIQIYPGEQCMEVSLKDLLVAAAEATASQLSSLEQAQED